METLLRNSTLEQLRNYFYDERGEFPPADFAKEELIRIILKANFIKKDSGTSRALSNKKYYPINKTGEEENPV